MLLVPFIKNPMVIAIPLSSHNICFGANITITLLTLSIGTYVNSVDSIQTLQNMESDQALQFHPLIQHFLGSSIGSDLFKLKDKYS